MKPDGIDLVPTVIHPSEMFWRQLKFQDFDISEMSMSSLMMATAQGNDDWVGIPIFTTRKFFHTEILVRKDAGINEPKDLKGKRVGVPEYQQTAALWTRGVLQHEFGVHQSEMEHWMERVPTHSHGGADRLQAAAGHDRQPDPDREEPRRDDGVGRDCRRPSTICATTTWSIARASTSSTIPTSRRCSPIRSPRACATTRRPASSRSTTAW